MLHDPNAKMKRKQFLLAGGIILIITFITIAGMFLLDNSAPSVQEKPKTVSITAPGTIEDKDAWRAQQSAQEKANERLIEDVRLQLNAQKADNEKLAAELAALKEAEKIKPSQANLAHNSSPSVLDKALPLETGVAGNKVLHPPTAPTGVLNAPLNQLNPSAESMPRELEIITFDGSTNNAGSNSKTTTIQFLPAGSFVRVAMLNGVDAPTGGQAQSNPLPVAFHVLNPANLANKHQLDIKDCRFIAAAWGDLSAERMMARTETLTCIINDEPIEMAVKGHVIGEDGKTGVRGRLVTKQGQLLANALFAGALSGIGSAFQQSATITSVGGGNIAQTVDSKKMAQAALGGGAGSAANMLAQYYLKAADKLYPVIETDGGRTVEILITKAATYNGSREDYRRLLSRNGTDIRRRNHD